MDTDELESLERDRLLGLDTKFNQRTQEKRFIKINDILTNPTDFTEIDFCFMGYKQNLVMNNNLPCLLVTKALTRKC